MGEMGDISTQQKLQLTRQVRERYQQDRRDLFQRRQLLYGDTSGYFEDDPSYDSMADYGDDYGERTGGWAGNSGTLGLRILLAAVLVCLLALANRRGDTLFGLTGSQIGEYIRLDYMPKF